MADDREIWLFSYGTLRQSAVQMALFGRLLDEEPDSLPGFRIDTIEIAEPDIVNLSGKATHLISAESAKLGATRSSERPCGCAKASWWRPMTTKVTIISGSK